MEQVARECPPASRQRGRVVGSGIGDAPLRGLAGSTLAARFRYWRGASGRRYLFSVFPLPGSGAAADRPPRFENAVMLAVARGSGDARTILAVDETGSAPHPAAAGHAFERALEGADEIHVHLLASAASERRAIRRDLLG